MDARSLTRSRAEIVFAELLVEEASPSESRVQDLCAAHPELAPELERLHGELVALRSRVSPWALPGNDASASVVHAPPDLGSFRCTRLLGRGGMGEVWEAHDLTLGRTVAVKLLRDSGVAGETGTQRFQREAQAAGRVHHPGIVAIHQAGEWQGRRYIVQELVPGGRTLRDEIEDLHRLPVLPADHARRVASRFEKLADALAAAHAAGIVHRDLKPQNVLLTPGGEPKVADFGLALLVSEVSLSRSGEFMGTYFYASPEQIEGEGRAVDEKSDVFSLGATLYENLTLSRAFDGDSVRAITRAVTLHDPPAPHLVRGRVPRDLSLVCMKALEKRPSDRYASMAEFRDDMRRFLAHEPIRARVPSLARRAWKWTLRHPTLATALVLLVAGLAGTSWQAAIAGFQRDAAGTQGDIARETSTFLQDILRSPDPTHARGSDVTARELLDRASEKLAGSTVVRPEVEAALRTTIGLSYQGLELLPEAEPHLARALELFRSSYGDLDQRTLSAALRYDFLLHNLGRYEEAEKSCRETLARCRAVLGNDHLATWVALNNLGTVLTRRGAFEEADRSLREVLERTSSTPAPADFAFVDGVPVAPGRISGDDVAAAVESCVLDVESNLALNDFHWGKLAEAEDGFRDVMAKLRRTWGDDAPDTLVTMDNFALVLLYQQKLAEAEQVYDELVESSNRVFGEGHWLSLRRRADRAGLYGRQHRWAETEAECRAVIDTVAAVGGDDATLVTPLRNMAEALQRQGKGPEAIDATRRALEIAKRVSGASSLESMNLLGSLGYYLRTAGRPAEALPLLAEAAQAYEEHFGVGNPLTIMPKLELARAHRDVGDIDEAAVLLQAILDTEPGSAEAGLLVEQARSDYEHLDEYIKDP
jgi:tetratricopeptide (TPR) repeat protein/tRNA A-37 threonylcarbamoyl transferase component Bud32